MMKAYEFKKAVKQGKMFMMRKYKANGEYGTAKLVTAEIAEKKSHVWVMGCDAEWHCPYDFELA